MAANRRRWAALRLPPSDLWMFRDGELEQFAPTKPDELDPDFYAEDVQPATRSRPAAESTKDSPAGRCVRRVSDLPTTSSAA